MIVHRIRVTVAPASMERTALPAIVILASLASYVRRKSMSARVIHVNSVVDAKTASMAISVFADREHLALTARSTLTSATVILAEMELDALTVLIGKVEKTTLYNLLYNLSLCKNT